MPMPHEMDKDGAGKLKSTSIDWEPFCFNPKPKPQSRMRWCSEQTVFKLLYSLFSWCYGLRLPLFVRTASCHRVNVCVFACVWSQVTSGRLLRQLSAGAAVSVRLSEGELCRLSPRILWSDRSVNTQDTTHTQTHIQTHTHTHRHTNLSNYHQKISIIMLHRILMIFHSRNCR